MASCIRGDLFVSHSSELSLEVGGVLAHPSLITLVIAELCTCGVLEQGWGSEGVKGATSSRITSTLCTILSALGSSFMMFPWIKTLKLRFLSIIISYVLSSEVHRNIFTLFIVYFHINSSSYTGPVTQARAAHLQYGHQLQQQQCGECLIFLTTNLIISLICIGSQE